LAFRKNVVFWCVFTKQINFNSGVGVFSIYAKAGTKNWIRLEVLQMLAAYFDFLVMGR
jgi:hypothetical protein